MRGIIVAVCLFILFSVNSLAASDVVPTLGFDTRIPWANIIIPDEVYFDFLNASTINTTYLNVINLTVYDTSSLYVDNIYNQSGGTIQFHSLVNGIYPENGSNLATKDYVDNAVSGVEFTFFLTSDASDITGYYVANETDTGAAESSLASLSLGAGDDQYLNLNWSTRDGQPEFTELAAGLYDMHIHLEKTTGTKPVNVYWQMYLRNETSGVEDLIITSEISSGQVTSKEEFDLHGVLATDTVLDGDDRLVVKLFANVGITGSDIQLTAYMEGTTDSHFTTRVFSSAFNDIFVRRDGTTPLTSNWNTGGFSLTNLDNLEVNDDSYIGLNSTNGRIEFDDQDVDEINILGANLGIGNETPQALIHASSSIPSIQQLSFSGATSTTDHWQSFNSTGTGEIDYVQFRTGTIGITSGTLNITTGQGLGGTVLCSYSGISAAGLTWVGVTFSTPCILDFNELYTIRITSGSTFSWAYRYLPPGGPYPGGIDKLSVDRDSAFTVIYLSGELRYNQNHVLILSNETEYTEIKNVDGTYGLVQHVSSIGTTSIFLAGGRVGIGTSSPTQELHVEGNANITETLWASNVSSNSPLQLMTSGITRIYIDDSNGNVGIGTDGPGYDLEVNGTIGSDDITYTGAGDFNIGTSVAAMRFDNGGSTAMYIDTDREIGIGTDSPIHKLDVIATGDLSTVGEVIFHAGNKTYGNFLEDAASIGITPAFTGYSDGTSAQTMFIGKIDAADDSGTIPVLRLDARQTGAAVSTRPLLGVYSYTSGPFMLMDKDGNVGIGTNNPSTLLEISRANGSGDVSLSITNYATTAGETAGINFRTTTGGGNFGRIEAYRIDGTDSNMYFNTFQSGTEATVMALTYNDKVEIGSTTLRRGKLNINDVPASTYGLALETDSAGRGVEITTTDFNGVDTGSVLQLYLGTGTGDTTSKIQAFDAGKTSTNDLLLQPEGGNVGIGISAPGVALGIGDGGITRFYSSGNDKYGYIYHDDTNFQILSSSGNITLNSATGVISSENIYPDANDARDLGNSIYAWRSAYIADNIFIGGSTVGTSGDNVLVLNTGTAPTTAPADTVQLYSSDESGSQTVFSIRTEKAVEALVGYSATHKYKIKINGVDYWIQLDQV